MANLVCVIDSWFRLVLKHVGAQQATAYTQQRFYQLSMLCTGKQAAHQSC
jgi:hypothetical protein